MRWSFLGALAVSAAAVSADPPATLSGWEKVFDEEFDGTSLDASKWNPTYNWGHTHNHRAYCAAENVTVSGGKLRIKGEFRRHPDAPQTATSGGKTYSLDYTSGAIDTHGKFSVQYGYIEGRFKAPWQLGTWPAFWMLQDGWPPEIDILEIPAARTLHHYYLHYTDPAWYASHGSASDHEASFGGTQTDVDKSAGFYNYGVEWDADNMNFYFNDKKIASYNRPAEISQTKAMYIIVNLAIGGWAGDNIQITADSPAYFEADWIRVWKAKNQVPAKVRIRSVAAGTCMMPDSAKKLVLGDCADSAAIAALVSLGGSVYRINFGDYVLEIPNESTAAGAAAGVWGWNGGAHQKVTLEVQSGFTGTVVRMKMNGSGHYLRSADGAVIQDWNTSWPWNQNWRIEDAAESPTAVASRKALSPTVVRYQGGRLGISPGGMQGGHPLVRILNMNGVELRRFRIGSYSSVDVSGLADGAYQIAVGEGRSLELLRFLKY